mmetsp:Transcript_50679/g.99270  ORF Transcript_50679/g.99270 Transcript_50679/m.99270 type:complete len:619 (+) Transcript_50679:41-1897(+)
MLLWTPKQIGDTSSSATTIAGVNATTATTTDTTFSTYPTNATTTATTITMTATSSNSNSRRHRKKIQSRLPGSIFADRRKFLKFGSVSEDQGYCTGESPHFADSGVAVGGGSLMRSFYASSALAAEALHTGSTPLASNEEGKCFPSLSSFDHVTEVDEASSASDFTELIAGNSAPFTRSRPAKPFRPTKRNKSKWYMQQSKSTFHGFRRHYRKRKGQKQEQRVPAYSLVSSGTESHGCPIYCVVFNFADLRHKQFFATCGANRATVYHNLKHGFEVMQVYMDESPTENLYTAAWSVAVDTGDPLLAVAGLDGVIKIINCHNHKMEMVLAGHGNAVNELRSHPRDPCLLLSVSKDTSVRLWNLCTGHCIAILAGENGHRDEVLSADFHLSGYKIVSAGMDHAIKFWDISPLQDLLRASYTTEEDEDRPFPTKLVQHPVFTTTRVHSNYVDCVRWMGDLVLSKSVDACITFWKPKFGPKKKDAVIVKRCLFYDCDIWYIRFCLDAKQRYLGVGNKKGAAFIWDATEPCFGNSKDSNDTARSIPKRLTVPGLTTAIRHVAFNFDASSFITVSDSGSINRFDAESVPPRFDHSVNYPQLFAQDSRAATSSQVPECHQKELGT